MVNTKKGFTLIELLVVIAIIGILSSVVLASLSSARNKGKDASAKSSMNAIRASAEIYYNGAGANSYGATGAGTVTTAGVSTMVAASACADADVLKLATAGAVQAGNTASCSVGSSAAGNTTAGGSYEAHVTLNDTTTFCVDSNGFSGKPSGAPTAGAAGTMAKCQ